MSTDNLINELTDNGICLWVENGKLLYRGPAATLTPEVLNRLADNKEALIALFPNESFHQITRSSLSKASPEARRNLSPEQQSFWFLDQMRNGNPCDHIAKAFRLRGPLNIDALQQGLHAIVQRHEALRTTFSAVDGEPCQIVHDMAEVDFSLVGHCSQTDERVEKARAICAELTRQPFDLTRGPLLRTRLVRLENHDHILLFVVHHIVADGRSFGLFFDELKCFYEQYCGGRESAPADLPIQYADYAAWRKQRLENGAYERQFSYWREQLREGSCNIDLPADRARPARQTPQGARRPVTIAHDLCRQLTALAREDGATLFMIVMAAFQALLFRYTGQDRITIGTPVSLRREIEFENLIGLFVTMQALTMPIPGDLSFRQLLLRTRQRVIETCGHKDVPFEELVTMAQPERDLSRNPLFQIMLQMSPLEQLSLEGIKATAFDFDPGTSQFDFSLHLFEDERGLEGYVEYDTDLFDGDRIERLITHFGCLLKSICLNRDVRIDALDLLPESERELLLTTLNGKAVDTPGGDTLHLLFEQQVERTPEAVAIHDHGLTISYAELNRRANQLAHYLLSEGHGPGSIFGVCARRSAGALVSFLASLKTGNAYLPLDPSYPLDRLAFMLQNSGAKLLIVEEELSGVFADVDVETLLFETEASRFTEMPVVNPSITMVEAPPAYIIYTSGSTGVPKGVVGTHAGTINRCRWMWETYPFTAGDRCAQKTPFSFVDHVWENFGPLLKGVPLVVISDQELADPTMFLDKLTEEKITHLTLVPSLLRVMLEAAPDLGDKLPSLRFCVTSGEALPVDLARRFLKATPDCALINLYGSSEVAADVTVHEVHHFDIAKGVIPIGRPLHNVRLYVLDPAQQLLPYGVHGELYVGGAQLAKGYLGLPELTEERFLKDPFDKSRDDARMFRTGDIVRYREDGVLEFLGRRDHQVKIRGILIDLGEIETTLRALHSVDHAVVTIRDDNYGSQQLLAHLTPQEGATLIAGSLREQLQKRLPIAMVPSAFCILDTFPLTPSGKIDRLALSTPSHHQSEARTILPLRTKAEKQLGDIWCKLLQILHVWRDDNFFELGGDSFLAMMMIAQASQAGILITANQLFEHQTLKGLASVARYTGFDNPIGVISDQAIEHVPFLLMPNQQRFLRRGSANINRWNVSMKLDAESSIDPDLLKQALAILSARHAALRLRFELDEERPRQWITGTMEALPLEIIDVSSIEDGILCKKVDQEAERLQESLDLVHGPTLRIAYFRTRKGLHDQLFVVLNHLVCDRYSVFLLLSEFDVICRRLMADERVCLPTTPVSLRDWVSWMEAYARSPLGEAHANEWLRLPWHDARPLPCDRTDDSEGNLNRSAEVVAVELSETETEKILNDRVYRPDEYLIAALQKALANWTKSDVVIMDMIQHGRDTDGTNYDLSRTIGMFVSYTPLVLRVNSVDGEDRLALIAETVGKLRRPSWSFGALHDYADPDILAPKIRRLPKADVLFNYHGSSLKFSSESLFEPVYGWQGKDHDPQGRREHLLAIQAGHNKERMRISFVYSRNFHRRSRIEQFAREVIANLSSDLGLPHAKTGQNQSPATKGQTLAYAADR